MCQSDGREDGIIDVANPLLWKASMRSVTQVTNSGDSVAIGVMAKIVAL